MTLYNQYGQPFRRSNIELADKQEKLKRMVIELANITRQLTKKDIRTWRQAWQMAINAENPRRIQLYRVYTDVEIDNHLTGIIEQLSNSVLSRGFKIYDIKTGKEVPELTMLLESEWFKNLMKYVLEARYWGHSLIQFGDLVTFAGAKRFNGVELIPREHVIPEFGLILRDPADELKKGISYREGKLAQWVIEAGYPKDLGLYLKCAPQAISKKNMLAFWDQFGELFGMPMRIAKSSSTDQKERSRIEQMLMDMGAAAWGLFPDGTDIDIKESTQGDAYNVYDKRIERANTEMSKAVLTVTMTTDNGSSLSQSKIHEKMLQLTIEREADRLKDIINNQVLPRLIAFGFPLTEHHYFNWDYVEEYTPEQQLAIENLLLNHFDIDEIYFREKYNIPIIGRLNAPAPTLRNFFAEAPQGGASDW